MLDTKYIILYTILKPTFRLSPEKNPKDERREKKSLGFARDE